MKRKYAEAIRRHGQPRGGTSGDEDESDQEDASDEDAEEAPPSKSRRHSLTTDEQHPWRVRRLAAAAADSAPCTPGPSGHAGTGYMDAAAAFGAASLAMLMHAGMPIHPMTAGVPPPHQLLQLATASALAQQGLPTQAAPWRAMVHAATDSGSGSGGSGGSGSGSLTAHVAAVSSSSQGTTLCRPKPLRLNGAMLQQAAQLRQAASAGQSALVALPQHWAGVATSFASAAC